MKKIEKLLPAAFQAVSLENGLVFTKGDDKCINSEYNGYISAFGASIQQSGLMAALVFNHRTTTQSDQDRKKLMDAIFHVVKSMRNDTGSGASDLFHYANDSNDKRRLKNQILDAATSLKLVIRTYKLIKS